MLILSVTNTRGMTIDRITAYDLMTIYGSDFGVSEKNLHGINHFSFSELTSRRTICAEGLKEFVLDGLITVKRGKGGFTYALTSSGRKYIEKLDSDYKKQYTEIIREVHTQYGRQTDTAVMKLINDTAVTALRR